MRHYYSKHSRACVLTLLFLIVSSGCGQKLPDYQNSLEQTSLAVPSLLSTDNPTLERLTDHTPDSDFPGLPTNSPSPFTTNVPAQPDPIITPLPTYTMSERLEIMDILDFEGRCDLPCWNGLEIGKARVSEFVPMVAAMGIDVSDDEVWNQPNGWENIFLDNFPPGTFPDPSLKFFARWTDQVIQYLHIELWDHPEQYPLSRIHARLGYPDTVKVINGAGNKYTVALFYIDLGTIIRITGSPHEVAPGEKGIDKACLLETDQQVISLKLFPRPCSQKQLWNTTRDLG